MGNGDEGANPIFDTLDWVIKKDQPYHCFEEMYLDVERAYWFAKDIFHIDEELEADTEISLFDFADRMLNRTVMHVESRNKFLQNTTITQRMREYLDYKKDVFYISPCFVDEDCKKVAMIKLHGKWTFPYQRQNPSEPELDTCNRSSKHFGVSVEGKISLRNFIGNNDHGYKVKLYIIQDLDPAEIAKISKAPNVEWKTIDELPTSINMDGGSSYYPNFQIIEKLLEYKQMPDVRGELVRIEQDNNSKILSQISSLEEETRRKQSSTSTSTTSSASSAPISLPSSPGTAASPPPPNPDVEALKKILAGMVEPELIQDETASSSSSSSSRLKTIIIPFMLGNTFYTDEKTTAIQKAMLYYGAMRNFDSKEVSESSGLKHIHTSIEFLKNRKQILQHEIEKAEQEDMRLQSILTVITSKPSPVTSSKYTDVLFQPQHPTPSPLSYAAPLPPSSRPSHPTHAPPSSTPSYTAPPPTYAAPPPTYAAQPPTYAAQPPPYAAQPPTYAAPPHTYPAQPPTYPAQPPTYPAPPHTYASPSPSSPYPPSPYHQSPSSPSTPPHHSSASSSAHASPASPFSGTSFKPATSPSHPSSSPSSTTTSKFSSHATKQLDVKQMKLQAFVVSLIASDGKNAVSKVKEICDKLGAVHEYAEVSRSGPSHIPQFVYELKITDYGAFRSKANTHYQAKAAKEDAALQALELFRSMFSH